MQHGDVRGEIVATTQRRPFAAMLNPRADAFGVAKRQIRAKTRAHLTSAVWRHQLRLQQRRHQLVRMAIYPVGGLVEADHADVKRCEAYARPPGNGTQKHCGKLAQKRAIFAEVRSLKLRALTRPKQLLGQMALLLSSRRSLTRSSRFTSNDSDFRSYV